MPHLRTATALCALLLLGLGTAHADLALAKARNCMNCHAVDKKIVGPALHDVALKYRADASAAPRLQQKVLHGGGGVWGVVKMPSNPELSADEAHRLVAWVLAQ